MLTPFSQGMPTFSLRELLGEAAQERLDDRLMHDQHLERGAALAVERQRAEQALLDRELDIGIGQDDGGVLGVEPQDGAQAVEPSDAASSGGRRPCSSRSGSAR